ncbi:relaxase/mobilization nuclease domain-containing protein [Methylocystis sp. FS]|uniref:LPD7 domain-containing protein n=1 Tax=Methylocystis silviterrae TaxID=2743612 RepID=UPI00158315F4|nr:LPD7 domain-containing protein [Methylocystis silviterrae]NUJ81851.1 relaxase/mobilization nuclease domain-containing protein [Methylocystis silviterrae]
MTTLAALDLSILTEGLQRRLAAKNRAALDDLAAAVQSAERYRAQTANSSRAPPLPRRDERPDTGPRAPAPGEKPHVDDELRVKRAAAVKGGLAQNGVSANALAAKAQTAHRSPPARGFDAPSTASRSPLMAKANLAAGSQAAVVKIASFGSGAARAQSLLSYQSDKGELTLERHDGLMITGQRSVADFAATWRAEDGRAPSNDVLQFAMRFDRRLEATQAQDALTEALRGHHYAWRLSQHGAHSRVDIVMTAASRERNAGGRLLRIYDNQRSIDGLRDRLEGAFGRDAEFTDPKWAHGVEGATTALARLTRGGEIEVFGPDGRVLKDEAERLARELPNRPPRAASREANVSLEIAKSWRPHMRSSAPRDFAHVILSAKPGTDKAAFMDAARATLARAFAGHEYVFVMHTNREHIHVHAAVRLVRDDGKRLDPKIQDFSRWRDTLAAEARVRGIAMENVRRFDQAHAPAYKLKDVKMLARGIAPPSVRRRVERVKNREIHRPTREEGRRRAQDAARQWRNVAALSPCRSPPPPAPGAVRLYRLDSGGDRRGALFAADMETAAAYAKPGVAARIIYVDVPAARVTELKSSRTQPGKVFVVPRAISALSRPLDGAPSAAIAHFQHRTESALRGRAPSTDAEETGPMRTAETMIAARDSMADTIAKIDKALPDDAARAQFAEQSRRLLDKADEAIAAQTNLEQQKADVQGDRYVKPEPARDLGPIITFERKGDEIHYHRHDATGALQTLAFVDNGKQLDIRDWNNADSVNAALKVASEKWETLNITGSDAYKETVARLAAEHGYKITNPEMQDRIRELRAEIEVNRARIAEGQAQPDEKQEAAPMARQDKRDEPARAEGPTSTAAERDIRLQDIRGRVDREAARETEQANRSKGAEVSAAQANEPSPDRSQGEAASAREADRYMEDNTRREMPLDPRQSEQMQNLREQQSRVLKQEEEQRRVDQENAARINRELAQPLRPEGEGESR